MKRVLVALIICLSFQSISFAQTLKESILSRIDFDQNLTGIPDDSLLSSYDFLFNRESNFHSSRADSNIEYVTSCLWTYLKDAAIEGEYAYCALTNGLMVFNISDLSNPDSISNLYLQGDCYSVQKQGNTLYLADGEEGLVVIDVSDPYNPSVIGQYESIGFASQIIVKDNLAYLLDSDSGLHIIDISNPNYPDQISSFTDLGRIHSIFLSNDVCYMYSSIDSCIWFVDVDEPQYPDTISRFEMMDDANSFFVKDNYMYIALIDSGLQVVNISDMENAFSMCCDTSYKNVNNLYVRDSTAFIAISSELHIVNVSDPCNIQPITSYSSNRYIHTMVELSDVVFLINSFTFGPFIDITDLSDLNYLGEHTFPNPTYDIAINDTLAYAIPDFHILNLSDHYNPEFIGSGSMLPLAVRIIIQNSIAYVGCLLSSMLVFDISDPVNPDSIGYYSGIFGTQLCIRDSIAYVGLFFGGFDIVNIVDPVNPSFLGNYTIPMEYYTDIFVMDSFLYGVSNNGLQILNVSDPEDIKYVNSYGSYTNSIFVQDSLAYVGSNYQLEILNVSDPLHIQQLSTYPATCFSITVRDSMAYIKSIDGLEIVNVVDPENPVFYGSYRTPYPSSGMPNGIAVLDSFVVIANVASVIILETDISHQSYKCGDANGDEIVDISDAVYVINFAFLDGPEPDPYESGDVNCDGSVDISDAFYVVNFVFNFANPPCDIDGNGDPDC